MASATSDGDSHDLSLFSAILVTPHSVIITDGSHPPLRSLATYGTVHRKQDGCRQEEDSDFVHLANLADPLAFDVLVLLLQV